MFDPVFPLRTERLDLRPYEPADLDELRSMQTLEEVTRYLYTDPMTEDERRDALGKRAGRVVLCEEGDSLNPLAVLRETGEVVGDVVLIYRSAEHRTGEVGFVLKPRFQGHGFATEMATEMLRLDYALLAEEWRAGAGRS